MRPLLSAFALACCLLPVHARALQLSSAATQDQATPSTATPAEATGAQATPTPASEAPCAHKDKECAKAHKAVRHKPTSMKIENGTLSVDGWTGKARLNYDLHEVTFLYVSVPGLGTVVASMQPFPNAVEQKGALDGKTLTLKTPDDHIVQISSEQVLLDKKPHTVFVALDKAYVQPGRFPSMGFGDATQAPYAWPGARALTTSEQKASAAAPPLPSSMRASQAPSPCQAPGQGSKSPECKQPMAAVIVPPVAAPAN